MPSSVIFIWRVDSGDIRHYLREYILGLSDGLYREYMRHALPEMEIQFVSLLLSPIPETLGIQKEEFLRSDID